MNKKDHKKMFLGGVIVTLSFLPGCVPGADTKVEQDQIETQDVQNNTVMTGETLASFNGMPIVTVDSLKKEKEKLGNANPQVKMALMEAAIDPQMSKKIDRDIIEGMVQQKVIDNYINSNKLNATAEYKNQLEELYESMRQLLNRNIFIQQVSVTVPYTEVKSMYDLNKDKIQGLTISQGGVAATGLEFTDEAAARAFATRAKTAPGGFKKVAQDDGFTPKVRDFKLVNKNSIGIDPTLRDSIVAINTVPSIETFEAGGAFWVVNATAKEEPKYVPFEQVKDKLKEQLEQNKRSEVLMKKMEELKKEYGLTINEDYFKVDEEPQEVALNNAQLGAPAADKRDALDKQLA